jgi:hypothetical protein
MTMSTNYATHSSDDTLVLLDDSRFEIRFALAFERSKLKDVAAGGLVGFSTITIRTASTSEHCQFCGSQFHPVPPFLRWAQQLTHSSFRRGFDRQEVAIVLDLYHDVALNVVHARRLMSELLAMSDLIGEVTFQVTETID